MIVGPNVRTGDGINDVAGLDQGPGVSAVDGPELAESPGVVIGNGSGSNEGPEDCGGLRGGSSDRIAAYDGAELVVGPNVRTGNGINDGAGLDQGPGVKTGNSPELAEVPGVWIGNGS